MSPPLSRHDLSKQLFRLNVATLLKSLAEEAMCSLNHSQRKITSGSRAMGLVLKRLLTLQRQKVRYTWFKVALPWSSFFQATELK